MTYRQWLKRAKDARAAAVPDIRDRLPLSADAAAPVAPHPVVLRRVIAGVAAAAVLVFAVGYAGFYALFGGNTGGTPAVSTPLDTPNEGEKIPLHTTVQSVTMLHGSTPTMVVDNMSMYVGARILHVVHNQPSEHSECQGVFYDMEQENYFCADHIMKPALEREGIPVKGVYMHYYHPVYGKIVFTSARSSYVYDMTSNTFHRLPVSLYYCPSVLGSLQTAHPYVFLHQMGGARDDLYLINLLTAELTYILKDSKGNYIYTPMDDVQITEDGKYVHYTLAKGGGEVVNSPARTTVLYDIATGKSRTFIGEVITYLSDTQRFFLNTPDGYVVYDIATEKKTPYAESDLSAHYAYYTKHTDVYTEFDYRLMLCNRITGEEKLVTSEYVVASVIKEQYLYYYIRGEEYLRVLDVVGGGEEYLPLDKELVQETESEENKDRSLHFGLQVEEERGEIWVYYSVTDTPRQDAEEVRQKRESWPCTHLDRLQDAEAFTSIAALEPILRRFPENVIAYEGDGYLYLDYTPLSRGEGDVSSSNRLVALEDYTSKQFYTINHQNGNIGSSFSFWKDGVLSADAARDTRTMLQALHIPIQPAERDYRPHIAGDPQIRMKAKLAEFSGEQVRAYRFIYLVQKPNGYVGARMYLEDVAELQELYEFIDFTDTLTYKKEMNYFTEEYQQYYKHHTYTLRCKCWVIDEYEIYIGRMNGKPFLVKRDCLADLTEEQYAEWTAWMDKQEKKGHVD